MNLNAGISYGLAKSAFGSRGGIYVAAVDSSAGDKAAADYICTGTADDVIINEAIVAAAVAANGAGGNIYLLAGNFSVSNPILLNQNGTRFSGPDQWRGTLFSGDPNPLCSIKLANGVNNDIVRVSGNKVWITNIFFDGNKANNTAQNYSPVYSDVSTTNGSAVISSATAWFVPSDIGLTVTGAGIPGGTTIQSLNFLVSPPTATLSANCTATATNVSVTIANRWVQGNGIAQYDYNAAADLHISYCYIFKCANNGMEIRGSQSQVNTVLPESCAGCGLHVSGSAAHNKFTVVTSNGNVGPGLIDDSIPTPTGTSEGVSQNTYVQLDAGSNTDNGVVIRGGVGKALIGCVVQNSKHDGILVEGGVVGLQIVGCSIANSGTATTGTYSGIHLAVDASTGLYPSGVLIVGNNIQTQEGAGQNLFALAYGIREDGAGTDPNLITNNTISGNAAPTVAGVLQSNAASIVQNNIGFKTANTGTATIANGTTSIAVSHGLAITPAIAKIQLTMQNGPTNAIQGPWVSSITSTQFTINCNTNPGASGAVISWMIVS